MTKQASPPVWDPLHPRAVPLPYLPFRDRKGYLDGPLALRVTEREHERLRAEFRLGDVTRHNVCHLRICAACNELLLRAQKNVPTYHHRDNTFADQTTSFDFESEYVAPDWYMNYVNKLRWDAMREAEGDKEVLPPTSREMAQLRGFVWDINQRPSRVWISAYRDDDTFHRRAGGNIITVVAIPRECRMVDTKDKDGNTVRDRRGNAVQHLLEDDWVWCVVQCEMVTWSLQTPGDLRRFQAKTGIRAKARKGYKRDVLTPLEKLQRDYRDLDEARDDALRWYSESEDLDDAFMREHPVFDPDVLYNARITMPDGAAYAQIVGPVRIVHDDED